MAGGAEPRQRQFTLAQLLAIVLAVSVVLAAIRLTWQQSAVHPLNLWLLFAGFVVTTTILYAVRLRTLADFFVVATTGVGLLALLVPAVSSAQKAAIRSSCQGRLKQIAVALHSYHDRYGCFPPGVVRDAQGRPLHSWRVLLLPFLERRDLYAKYRIDEPWDGPNNRKLHGVDMPLFSCESRTGGTKAAGETPYVVVAGPRTAFPDGRCVALSEVSDDPGQTLLVVEIEGSGIHWMEPRDLYVTQMSRRINPPSGQGISSPHPTGGANVVMVDGTVTFLSADELTESELESLVTIAAGD